LTPTFTEVQLDALRELANIGSGNAGTALSTLLGRPVELSVPNASALPLADVASMTGDPAELRHGVVVPVGGEMDAEVVLLFPQPDARALCALFGLDPSTDDGRSMLAEVGNILGSNYINVLGQMVGLTLEPSPPQVVEDMLGAILQSILMSRGEDVDIALVLDSSLTVAGESCRLSFLLLPAAGGVHTVLERLGL
jgi:chemotaxis protein CheC